MLLLALGGAPRVARGERLGLALHLGTLVPHAGLAAFHPGASFAVDGELPLDRRFSVGMQLGIEFPLGYPKLRAAHQPPDANDLIVAPVLLPFARAYGTLDRSRPFAFAGLGVAGLIGQVGRRDSFTDDTTFPTGAVGAGVQWWTATRLALELTYRFQVLRAKGTIYTYSVVAIGGRFRMPAEAE